MPIRLTAAEKKIARQLAEMKKKSGSHSPSPSELARIGIRVRHDFCFLSNPYATELFVKYFRKDFARNEKLRALVGHYPSQNRALADKLSKSPLVRGALPSAAGGVLHPPSSKIWPPPLLGRISERNTFVGNGATEIIQAVLQHFTKRKILVPVPTFSPYLEFAPSGREFFLSCRAHD